MKRFTRGGTHRLAKLTEEAVQEIRLRYAAGGTSHRKLAQEFGISKSNIGHVISGRSWSHNDSPITRSRGCLSDVVVRSIRRARRNGESYVEIARLFGCSAEWASRICRGLARTDS